MPPRKQPDSFRWTFYMDYPEEWPQPNRASYDLGRRTGWLYSGASRKRIIDRLVTLEPVKASLPSPRFEQEPQTPTEQVEHTIDVEKENAVVSTIDLLDSLFQRRTHHNFDLRPGEDPLGQSNTSN